MEERNRTSNTIADNQGQYVILLSDIIWDSLGHDNISSTKDLVVVHHLDGFPVHFYNEFHWNVAEVSASKEDGI